MYKVINYCVSVYCMAYQKKTPWLRNLVVMLVVITLVYVGYEQFFKKPEPLKAPPPPSVTIQQVQIADIPLFYDYAGRLAGSREVEIRPRVGGIILQRLYTEGQFVKQGAVLFQIDPAPYQAALAQAQATYDQAAKDYKRSMGLRKEKALSPKEFEAAEGQYGQSKAALDTAKINLAWTSVRAPITGYTSEEGFSEGSLVTADTSLLTRLTQLDPMYVEFAYPDTEATAQRIAVANGTMTLPKSKLLSAEVHMEDGSIYPVEGKINFTDSIIDQQTGTVKARATLPNAHMAILPGQFVRVVVKGLTLKNAVAVPEQAILQGPKGTFVYVVDTDSNAKVTPVKLGLLNRHLQLITDGLKPGDRIITAGMIKVKADKPVTIDSGEQVAPADDMKPDASKKDDSKADDKKPDAKTDDSKKDDSALPVADKKDGPTADTKDNPRVEQPTAITPAPQKAN